MKTFEVLKDYQFASAMLRTHSFINYCILFSLISFIVSAATFVYENLSELTVALRACNFIFFGIQTVGMFFSYAISLNKIHVVHAELQEIIDKTVEGTFIKRSIHISFR